MRIVIDIQGDESSADAYPASVTITFPPVTTPQPARARPASRSGHEQPMAAEDAGPAPPTDSTRNEPVVHVAMPSGSDTVQVNTDMGEVADHLGILDAGPAPLLVAGAAMAGATNRQMMVSGEGSTLAVSPEPVQAARDDLTVIDGIGPKISSALAENGITTYRQLAACEHERLVEILAAEKIRANAETWPGQAAIAATGDMSALRAYQSELRER